MYTYVLDIALGYPRNCSWVTQIEFSSLVLWVPDTRISPWWFYFVEESDVKAAIAALSFILSSAAKHSVDGSSLDNELQQLGLPKGLPVLL